MDRKAMSAKKRKYKNFSVNVLGLKVPVIFKKVVKDKKGNDCAGLFKYIEKTNSFNIYVSTGENAEHIDVVSAFYHEYFHALCHRLGVANAGMPDNVEEILADGLGVIMSENFDNAF